MTDSAPAGPAPAPAPLADVIDAALELTVAPSWSRVGVALRRRLYHWDQDAPPRLDGHVVLLTGFTSGIGWAAAEQLGALGATLHLVGRDPARVRDTAAALRGRGSTVSTSVADLTDLEAVRRLADEVGSTHGALDVLIHNAGALNRTWTSSPQGFEATTAAMVLAPFLLTNLLLPQLQAVTGRVLTMSSGGMYATPLRVDHLDAGPEGYSGATVYAQAKRAQIGLTAEWARRVPDVAFHALHPGWVDTPGVASGLPLFRALTRPILRTPAEGADTLVWLTSEPLGRLGPTGGFWLDRRRRGTDKVPWTRSDAVETGRLWDWCGQRTGISA